MTYLSNIFILIKNKFTPQHLIAHNCAQHALKYLLITTIVLITIIKLNLIGTGFMAFPDEIRYGQSGMALQHLSELEIGAAIDDIFCTQGRPADAVIKIIPNAIQFVTAHIFGLNYYESNNSYPLFIFNFIIYCIILVIHFKLSYLLFKDTFLALASVLLYSTLINSYLYLRHALPYDMSLLILYLAIYKIVIYTEENSLSPKKSLIIGFCSFLGYLVYPGYFPLLFVGLFIIFFTNFSNEDIVKKIYYSSFYILGGILCLLLFEKIGLLVGRSYILDAIGLSKTITQGSFEESFVYILKYLFEVEGVTGIIILISLFIFFIIIIYQIINNKYKQYSIISLLGIALLGMYSAYAFAGYFLHKVVFYGRLLHQYLPFICILSIYAMNELLIRITRKNQLILYAISIIFIVNFGFNFINFKSYTYPRDIYWQLIKTNILNDGEFNFKYDDRWPLMPKGKEVIYYDIHGKPISSYYNIVEIGDHFGGSLYIVKNLTKQQIFNPNDNYYLLESKPSFMNFKAYQYDSGAAMNERQCMDKMNLQIEIFASAEPITGFITQKNAHN
jgi:hypothetical protein